MAVFIRQENQKILWNTIQNIELFHHVLTDTQKPLWFKEMIGIFYEKCRDRRLSRPELENLNRQVIEYMVSSLKMLYVDMTQRNANSIQKSAITQSAQKRVSFQEDIGIGNTQVSGTLLDFRPEFSSNLEKKAIQSQQYVSEYSNRQQEYEQMMKRETPPDVNFKEEIADNVIKNMDELLEKQRKQRELDIQEIPRIIQPTQSIYGGGRKKLVFYEEEGEDTSLPPVSVLELQDSTIPSNLGKDTMEILEELKKDILEIKQILASMNTSQTPTVHENTFMEEIHKTSILLPSNAP